MDVSPCSTVCLLLRLSSAPGPFGRLGEQSVLHISILASSWVDSCVSHVTFLDVPAILVYCIVNPFTASQSLLAWHLLLPEKSQRLGTCGGKAIGELPQEDHNKYSL